MASFTITCACGELFHADDTSAGRQVRCRRCDRVVKLERPVVAALPSPAKSTRKRRRRRAAPSRVARVLRVVTWAYVAAMAAIALVMWTLGDRWWPATFLLFMGRWVFLLPLAVLVPAALVLRPKLLLPIALGALITLGPVMGARAGLGRLRPSADGMKVRVVTFNVDGGREIAPELPMLLALWTPDILLFQECGEELAAMTERMAGWHAHHAGPLCMLTRFSIDSARVMDRSALERVRRDDAAGIGGAGYVVRYTLTTPGGAIDVTNLHLETPRKGFEGLMSGDVEQLRENTTLRNLESSLARRWVDAGRAPAIVAGDFNTPVESRIFQEHWSDFTDAFSRAGRGLGMTKYNGWIRIRIDHVLSDGAWWRTEGARVWRDVGSDHRALIADLVLVAR